MIPASAPQQPQLLKVAANADAQAVWQQLIISPFKALIALSGGAGKMDLASMPELQHFFQHVLAPFAVQEKVGFIDGGTDAGVMALLGRGLLQTGVRSPSIGITPEPEVNYPGKQQPHLTAIERNHTHVVLIENATWGEEIDVMYGLVGLLAQSMPALTVLVNGGQLAYPEVMRTIQLNLPLIVLQGSGRLADRIVNCQQGEDDPEIADIIRYSKLHLCSIHDDPAQLIMLLKNLLQLDTH